MAKEYQLTDNVTDQPVSPVTSAETVYLPDGRNVQTALEDKADADKVVDLTSAQTINGAKTFEEIDVPFDALYNTKNGAHIEEILDNVVYRTGDQNIRGKKTFEDDVNVDFTTLVDVGNDYGTLGENIEKLTALQLKVGEKAKVTPALTEGVQIATLTTEDAEGQAVETPLYAPQGGGGGGEWEKLCDTTTSANVSSVSWEHGDDGQVFNDYNELIVVMLLQPAPSTERRFRMSIEGGSAWGGKYLLMGSGGAFNVPASTEHSALFIATLKKTVIGIVQDFMISANNTSVSNTLVRGVLSNSGSSIVSPIMTTNTDNPPSILDNKVFVDTFGTLAIGGFTQVLSADCRFQIFGKK